MPTYVETTDVLVNETHIRNALGLPLYTKDEKGVWHYHNQGNYWMVIHHLKWGVGVSLCEVPEYDVVLFDPEIKKLLSVEDLIRRENETGSDTKASS